MAWTAGIGRSHFAHRAGVVFDDAASLRAGLSALADSSNGPGGCEPPKTAFVYPGDGDDAAAAAEALYRSEPVAKALFERCDAVLRAEGGASLLDRMSGESGPEQTLDDPALYALQCALTALWSSVGVRPSAVVGFGAGELAAAHAAGVLDLEQGIRLAAAREAAKSAALGDGLNAALAGIAFRPPTIALVSGVTGRALRSEEVRETACGLRHLREPAAHGPCLRTLADREVGAVVEIGPRGSVGPTIASHWPKSSGGAGEAGNGAGGPVVLPGPGAAGGNGSAPDGDVGFVEAVARAYEAGLPVAFCRALCRRDAAPYPGARLSFRTPALLGRFAGDVDPRLPAAHAGGSGGGPRGPGLRAGGPTRSGCSRENPEAGQRTLPATRVGESGSTRAGSRNPRSASCSGRTPAGRCWATWDRPR